MLDRIAKCPHCGGDHFYYYRNEYIKNKNGDTATLVICGACNTLMITTHPYLETIS